MLAQRGHQMAAVLPSLRSLLVGHCAHQAVHLRVGMRVGQLQPRRWRKFPRVVGVKVQEVQLKESRRGAMPVGAGQGSQTSSSTR